MCCELIYSRRGSHNTPRAPTKNLILPSIKFWQCIGTAASGAQLTGAEGSVWNAPIFESDCVRKHDVRVVGMRTRAISNVTSLSHHTMYQNKPRRSSPKNSFSFQYTGKLLQLMMYLKEILSVLRRSEVLKLCSWFESFLPVYHIGGRPINTTTLLLRNVSICSPNRSALR